MALSDVKRNLLTVLQGFKAFCLNFGEVCEQIVAANFRRNKAEAFSVVKPLYGPVAMIEILDFSEINAGEIPELQRVEQETFTRLNAKMLRYC